MTVMEVLQALWQRRWLFVAVFATCFGAFVAYTFLATPVYKVTVKLMPKQNEESIGGVGSLLSQFAGVSSLVGLGAMASVNEQEALAWLRSRRFAEGYIRENNLLPILFAKKWDAAQKQWRRDLNPKAIPTMEDAWEMFDKRIRRVSRDAKTKIVTLELFWKDRDVAQDWANDLVVRANAELRQRALEEADASLNYLSQQLSQTDVVELQQSIYKLMEAQITKKVVANSRPDYAFTIIDPAVAPDADRFARPRRLVLLALSIPISLLLAASATMTYHLCPMFVAALRRTRTQPADTR